MVIGNVNLSKVLKRSIPVVFDRRILKEYNGATIWRNTDETGYRRSSYH
jgi:hypothetical protein